jgi:2-keto-4-pentenoate hydratase/2-oxohepta-3-ene-1,7-dioic acid hydratase in catechol pathway
VRIARAHAPDGGSYIVGIDGGAATPLLPAAGGPGRDALRDALAEGVDLAGLTPVGEASPLASWTLDAPVSAPGKILAIGLNYADHAREGGLEPPAAPITFVKTLNSLIGPDAPIRYSTSDSTQVDYEAELAVVIGRTARRVSEAEALDAVFGYTACNDVSARDAQFGDGQWVRGKSFDTFCPLGPWIVTADEIPDPQALGISCRVNGTTLQDSTTAEMIFGVAELISYLSRVMTLEPGDVIATGTPVGVGFARTPPVYLLDGDVVEVEIERIGVLRNPVAVDG